MSDQNKTDHKTDQQQKTDKTVQPINQETDKKPAQRTQNQGAQNQGSNDVSNQQGQTGSVQQGQQGQQKDREKKPA
jgi:hypothetical protein